MAQLSKVKNNKPIPIGVEGIFIHNMPAKQMQDIFGNMNERLKTEPETVILELFTKLICDDKGETFEDVATYDSILDVLSLKDIQEIMTGIAETMNPSNKDLGK
jgi:hypothetical protein